MCQRLLQQGLPLPASRENGSDCTAMNRSKSTCANDLRMPLHGSTVKLLAVGITKLDSEDGRSRKHFFLF